MTQPYLASSIPESQLSEFYRLMTEEIGDVAIFFMDTSGVIVTWNRAAELIKGYTAEDAIGEHLALLYTLEDRERKWPQHNLQEAVKNGYYKEETWRRKKDGSLFWARICLTALRDHADTLVGFSKITLDLTHHKLLENCVSEREQTRRVLRAANAGTWRWNPHTAAVTICENFLQLLGHAAPDTTISTADWLDYFHEHDRPRVVSALEAARRGAAFELEFRLRVKDGDYRWFFSRAEWFRRIDAEPWELNGVNVEIDSVKAAQEEVRRAVEKLREADLRKDEFLAMLAHELRNPLAPIRAGAEVMRRSSAHDERLRKTSEVIVRQSKHLTGLVDDLLDVSRVTRGLIELQRGPQNIRHVLTDAIEQVAPALQARQHHLSVLQSPDTAVVLGDAKRLVQVVSNLLNNAVKYTPPGGHIVVSTEVRQGMLYLAVEDNGIGMDAETVEHAFELFSQATRSPDRAGGGLGLGLALVKSLVELHGGSVTCRSEGLHRGSTFTVCLPLAPSPEEAGQAAPATQRAPAAPTLRVTIVDDNTDAADMLALLLQGAGHQVTTHATAKAALEDAAREPADVYLLDIGSPEMDGYELARRLRAQATKLPVFIAVSGYAQEADRAAATAAGFADYMVKPVDGAELLSVLNGIASAP